jgi:hypothetical protein
MDMLKLIDLVFFNRYVKCSIDNIFLDRVHNQKNVSCSF